MEDKEIQKIVEDCVAILMRNESDTIAGQQMDANPSIIWKTNAEEKYGYNYQLGLFMV